MKKYLTFLAFSFLFLNVAQSQTITTIETDGNLAITHKLSCDDANKIKQEYTPADMYSTIPLCLKEKKYMEAIRFMVTAGVYGMYDASRVPDKSAHQAITVLKMYYMQDRPAEFTTLLNEYMKSDKVKELCAFVKKVGPPNYYPGYMVQHGLEAFKPKEERRPIIEFENKTEAFNNSLNKYLHCDSL